MKPYSLLFEPILKEKVWGGDSLASLGKKLPEGVKIGESWELADLEESIDGGRSVISNGPLKGHTLRQALDEHEKTILGAAKRSGEGGFPLLIKYLDARENLSVQVHPDEAYSQQHPKAHLKSEAWFVIEAQPGAVIYKGLKEGLTGAILAEHIQSGQIVDDLIAIPAKAGDCHYLPSGTCHALGAGIVVAEIQTPSDTTFRLYDWGRTDRQLHIEEALVCLGATPGSDNLTDPANQDQDHPNNKPIQVNGVGSRWLASTDYFEIEEICIDPDVSLEVVTNNLPVIWMLISGAGRIETPERIVTNLQRGDTTLMPAALQSALATFTESSRLLQISLPSPLRGLIA